MLDKITAVRNPLTIIAIFAGLAEISGTGILPFIAETNQTIYIWFLMIFPLVLVVLFFLTLNFNPRVLYSPSDFRDEANYMKIFTPSSAAQKLLKIQEEVEETTESSNIFSSDERRLIPKVIKSQPELAELMKKDPRMRYQLAESLVIDRLAREFHTQPQRDLSLLDKSNKIMFDAVFQQQDGVTVVEVKYFSGHLSVTRFNDTLNRIHSALQSLPMKVKRNSRLIFAIAYDSQDNIVQEVKRNLEAISADWFIPVEVRLFSLPDLLKELDLK